MNLNRRRKVARRNIPKSRAADRHRRQSRLRDVGLFLLLAAIVYAIAWAYGDVPVLKFTYPDNECVGIWTSEDGEQGQDACEQWLAANPDARYEHVWVGPR